MNYIHVGDLPEDIKTSNIVAVDTETMGLNINRDKLCLVQLSFGDKNAHLVQLNRDTGYNPVQLKKILNNKKILKIFHYARFDLAILKKNLGILPSPVYCTKIASKIARTYTDKHGLKELCKELLAVDLNKSQQSSDWSSEKLSENQIRYASYDVIHLFELKERLERMLEREKRLDIAKSLFSFLPTRIKLDLLDFADTDIFSH